MGNEPKWVAGLSAGLQVVAALAEIARQQGQGAEAAEMINAELAQISGGLKDQAERLKARKDST